MIVFQDSLRIIDRDGSKITITSLTANKSMSFSFPIVLSKLSPLAHAAAVKAGFPVDGTMVVGGVMMVHAAAAAIIEKLNAEVRDLHFRKVHAAKIEKALSTGKPVVIDSWSYEGRGEDGMVYVDLMVRGDGSTFKQETKTY